MIKIIIKKNGTTGWVELPLRTDILNSIRPEQFLNEKEMVNFAIHEIELNHSRIWREIKACTSDDLCAEKLNTNLIALVRWINDSFGLLLIQNKNSNGNTVMMGVWCKIHNHVGKLECPEKEKSTYKSFSKEMPLG